MAAAAAAVAVRSFRYIQKTDKVQRCEDAHSERQRLHEHEVHAKCLLHLRYSGCERNCRHLPRFSGAVAGCMCRRHLLHLTLRAVRQIFRHSLHMDLLVLGTYFKRTQLRGDGWSEKALPLAVLFGVDSQCLRVRTQQADLWVSQLFMCLRVRTYSHWSAVA